MGKELKQLIKTLASMRLTVPLLALAIALVFAGTLAQTSAGIWDVQKTYFHSFVIWYKGIPLPGGFTIGGLMLVNLLAAHLVRFRLGWKRAGVILVHSGLIIMFMGELVTSLYAVEMQMTISEGQAVSYAQDTRHVELAVIDPSNPDSDLVVAIPGSWLREGRVIRHDRLPFEVRVERHYANSTLLGPAQAGPNAVHLADTGIGAQLVAVELPDEADPEKISIPTTFVTLGAGTQKLGTFMASVHLNAQPVQVGDKTYLLALRFRRYYKPYTVQLQKFTHEKYAGTDTPKNFASKVRLIDPRHNEDREVLIYMNNPLRYDGETFYQAGFANNDTTTILQVVRNPGAWLPYVSCVVVGAGMLLHFGIELVQFLRRRLA